MRLINEQDKLQWNILKVLLGNYFDIYEQFQSHAQSNWARKKVL